MRADPRLAGHAEQSRITMTEQRRVLPCDVQNVIRVQRGFMISDAFNNNHAKNIDS